jgi:hypothetical protein
MSGFSKGTLSSAKKMLDEGFGIAKIVYLSFRFSKTIWLLACSFDEKMNTLRTIINVVKKVIYGSFFFI